MTPRPPPDGLPPPARAGSYSFIRVFIHSGPPAGLASKASGKARRRRRSSLNRAPARGAKRGGGKSPGPPRPPGRAAGLLARQLDLVALGRRRVGQLDRDRGGLFREVLVGDLGGRVPFFR